MEYYPIREKGRYGCMDEAGNVQVPPEFEFVGMFSEGLAWATKEVRGKVRGGFINPQGEWEIPPRYEGIQPDQSVEQFRFVQGLAQVPHSFDRMLFIDRQGKAITKPNYEKARPFSEERALVVRDKKVGYINAGGEEVIPCQYLAISPIWKNSDFHELLAAVRFSEEEDSVGFLNRDGEAYFEPQFTGAARFQEGLAMVRIPADLGEWRFIDDEGEMPIARTSQAATVFSQGLADYWDQEQEGYGYITKEGEWAFSKRFEASMRFCRGLAPVIPQGKTLYGYIDQEGQQKILPRFSQALPFDQSLTSVMEDGRWGYINTEGVYLWREKA